MFFSMQSLSPFTEDLDFIRLTPIKSDAMMDIDEMSSPAKGDKSFGSDDSGLGMDMDQVS
jgi:hypothetical protein